MEKDFKRFMSQLKETNATLDFYTDFNKIRRNVQNIEISLNMLNFLLGKDDLYSAVKALWDRDPKVFNVLDILIATRREGKKKFIDVDGEIKLIRTLFSSVDGIMKFFNETGLADFFKNKDVHDLVDYVFGVEAGLDTHARKNRSGDATESLLHRILQTNGIPHGIEVYSTEYDELRDVNFYNDGGSKLNEVARAYRELSTAIKNVDGFEFVWITDGKGWNSAKSKLEEAYYEIPRVYNFTTLPEFIAEIKNDL